MAYNWKNTYKFAIGLAIGGYWSACSPKKFDKDANFDACQNFNQTCVRVENTDYFDYSLVATGGLADILIVNDNSGSMSFEQQHMADRFSTFLSQLESKHIDYRIGVITTDISSGATATTADDSVNSALYNEPRSINQNGALMDGKLITFPNGQPYLSSGQGSFADREAWFKSVIKRPETLNCEATLTAFANDPRGAGAQGHANCPSGDERGIFAANLFVNANPASFIRPKSVFSIIVLADEDERSGLYQKSSSYALESKDEPATLVSLVNSKFAGKSFQVHSIVVKDNSCQNQQSNQLNTPYNPVYGSIGSKYIALSNMTSGYVGNICANDYGSQLTDIATEVGEQIKTEVLACDNAADLQVVLEPANPAINFSVSGRTLTFSDFLPPGTKARFKYSCPTIL
jgi:hypothetical protein